MASGPRAGPLCAWPHTCRRLPRSITPASCSPASPNAPLCEIPSGGCFFTGPWTRSSLRVLRRVAAFCRPLRPVLLLVSFPRSRSPVAGVPGLCWMWQDVPFARQPPCVTFRPVVVPLRGPGTRSSLRVLCRVAAFCRPLRRVLLLVSLPRSRSPVAGVLGLNVAWCAVCASAAPNSWRIEDVLVVAGVV